MAEGHSCVDLNVGECVSKMSSFCCPPGSLCPLHPCLHPHCLLSLTDQLSGGREGALASRRHSARGDPAELQPGARLSAEPRFLWASGRAGGAGRRRRSRGTAEPGSFARGGGGG